MNIKGFFLFLSVFLFSITVSNAQTTQNTEKVDEKTADVAITANVEIKELKFEVVPTPKVEFPGKPERKTEWSSERKNLPDSVEPNVIYRDVGIKLKIVSIFADIDKIVDEALGINPQTAETQSTENTAPANANKPEETAPSSNDDKKTETAKPTTKN